jgi:hypothetical protein
MEAINPNFKERSRAMSERFPTEIAIGGPVGRKKSPALIQKLNEEELQHEWGSGRIPIKSEEDLLSYRNSQGELWLCDEERSWGEFDELEEFLVKNGIGFNRRHCANAAYSGELAQFRKGMKSPCVEIASDDRTLFADMESVAAIRDKLRANPAKRGIRKALKDLDALCAAVDIPPLSPFQITD